MTGRDHRGVKVQKFLEPIIFELANDIWPEAGFDYFLAQMRRPGEDAYFPVLLFGGQPIDAKAVSPPPAPSFVAPRRGLSMLRADQSPSYWEGPAPAVALSHASLYVHYTADCFSLLGYVAHNRHMYLNRPISRGYNGGPYDYHVRGHSGVVVDGLQAEPIGQIPNVHDFNDTVQYNRIWTEKPTTSYTGKELRSSDDKKRRAEQVYPGVDMARSLLLRDEYLFDVFYLESEQQHTYHWLVHALGEALPNDSETDVDGWQASDDLQHSLFNHPSIKISDAKVLATDENWLIKTQQNYMGSDVSTSALGSAWYDKQIGIQIRALAEPGTRAWTYVPPTDYEIGSPRGPREGQAKREHDEAGAINIAIERQAKTTAFVVLHEPFTDGSPRIAAFERLAQTEAAVAARIIGPDYQDIICLRFDRQDQPTTLSFGEQTVTFTNYVWMRQQGKTLTIVGDIHEAALQGTPGAAVTLNGADYQAVAADGSLSITK